MNWDQEQYTQLTNHYRDLPDEDLFHLAAAPEELTEIAEEILKKEMARRKVDPKPPVQPEMPTPAFTDAESPEEPDGDLWFNYALMAPPHCTFEFETTRQAEDASAFLLESKIDCQVLRPNADSISLLGPRLVVRPKDADRAAQILSQPIPDHIANEPDIVAEDFSLPACPTCNTPDPVLIAVDPTNRWLCEACEHEWDDPA
jgi:hypothetical protein